MSEELELNEGGKIYEKSLEVIMHEGFMPYAEHVIMERALPRVEDGLKPVQRRILYSMNELGITPDKPYKKCARIVGECLGKYHPHGDTSVYDALVHMAQDFRINEVLIEGQGNFGSADGDGAAAMRYTEARLSPLAMEMLRDLDKDTVTWTSNFDDTLKEPEILPGRFPNLLVNGATGIAVGLNTEIPTHNLAEVIDGTVCMINNMIAHKKTTLEELMKYIKGPDFLTGGEVVCNDLASIYRTGMGSIAIRATFHVEKDGDKRNIVFTEFPRMNKQKGLTKLSEYVADKKPGYDCIADVVDESDREGVRAVIKLKRDANVKDVVAMLYKDKALNMRMVYSVKMVAIADGKPKLMGLVEILTYYINYQRLVIKRRSQFDLAQAKEREEILCGLLIAINNIDEVVRIIKKSGSTQEAKATLRVRFDLTEKQAIAILDMRLRKLCALEVKDLQAELAELRKLIAELTAIVASEKRQLEVVSDELLAIKRKYKSPRHTRLVATPDIVVHESVDPEKVVVNGEVILHQNGNLKFVPSRSYATCSKELTEPWGVVRQRISTSNDKLLFVFGEKGSFGRMTVRDLKERKLKEKGFALRQLFPKAAEDEKIVSMVVVDEKDVPNTKIVAATSDGMVRVTELGEYMLRDDWGAAIKLRDDNVRVVLTTVYNEKSTIALATDKGKVARVALSEFLPKGRLTMGAGAVKLNDDDVVIAADVIADSDLLLCVSKKGNAKIIFAGEITVMDKMRKGTEVMADLMYVGKIEKGESIAAMVDGEVTVIAMDNVLITDVFDRGDRLVNKLGAHVTEVCVHKVLS